MYSFFIQPFVLTFSDKKLSLDIKIFSLLVSLLPFALITGPAIPDIILSITSLYFILKTFLERSFNYYKNNFFYLFIIFSIYSITRSIFSEFPFLSLSLGGSVFFFRYIFFGLAVWYLIEKNTYLNKCLISIVIICIIPVSLDGYYQYFFDRNILGYEKYDIDRLTGFFGKEPIIGRYLSLTSIFLFYLVYKNYEGNKKILFLFTNFIFFISSIIFLSGERAPLFYFILFFFLVFIFIPNLKIPTISGIILSISIIFATMSINPVAKERIINTTFEQVSSTSLPFLPYSPDHEQIFVSSLKMFIEYPIYGIGTNLFRHYCYYEEYLHLDNSCATHPHQYLLQLLAELGIIGLLFYLIFFIFLSFLILKQLISMFFKTKKTFSPKEILVVILVFVYWWPIIPHMSLYNNWNNVLMMLPLGYLLRILYARNK